ncbi:hypothetical protein BDKNPLJD_01024 [Lactobacillus helveticus]|uniref:Uncharacterized protein n=1 Tax=Lactobacillus helveticus TaxID=1587 RepID=A0A2X0R9A3_LACHE|nr:hypothetical protein BDKNPLJD_01024 [Lactobacillus helveticus]
MLKLKAVQSDQTLFYYYYLQVGSNKIGLFY